MKFVMLNGKLTSGTRGLAGANAQEKTVTPSEEVQVVTADAGYSCLDKVNVEAVTSAIDSNIIPENIKKDVSILGVTGTLESGGGEDLQSVIDNIIEGSAGTTNFDVTSNATQISQYKFENCKKLINGNFPNATSIGTNSFYYCQSLTSINIPNVTSIGAGAFFMCQKLKNIELPNATSIGQSAFKYSGLTSINIPNVTSIPQYAFEECSSLTSIVMPKVTSINSSAFSNCSSCLLFDFRGATQVPTLSSTGAFWRTPSSKKIVVPDDLYDSWITATNWSSRDYNIVTSIIKASDYEASL